MKQVAIVAFDMQYAEYLKGFLENMFSEYANFNCYDVKSLETIELIKDDVVVFSGYRSFQKLKTRVSDNTEIIQADRTLNKDAISKLSIIPPKSKALLVNIDYRNCIEVIETIYSFGFSSLELEPYYPGCKFDETIKIAITPGEVEIAPNTVRSTIDIGQRTLNKECLLRIADALNAQDIMTSEHVKKILDQILTIDHGVERMFAQNRNLYANMETLLKIIQKGIIITDRSGKILLANDLAKTILGSQREKIEGFNLYEVFPEFTDIRKMHENGTYDKLIEIDGKEIVATFSTTETGTFEESVVIMVEPFNDIEKRQHKIRKKIRDTGHRATYTFDRIISKSPEMEEVKKIAKRMALADSNICIYGESGTGKELFAQSIHNYSKRKDYLFVAINCSALPENLLESELYGYEEGAFSGAIKGGKIGLFEMAHKGTLFLDEIGEMPLQMQAKLLRAIEEHKILKIGGRNLIDVDARIICASNRNLREMVEEGSFREDLYYRLCVLPIKIPPLRNRTGDIEYLTEKLKEEIGANFFYDEEAKNEMLKYRWPGNIRELKNNIEYLANLGKEMISVGDLPIFKMYDNIEILHKTEEKSEESFSHVDYEQLSMFVLEQIEGEQQVGAHIGRQQLTTRAKKRGFDVSEQNIRKIMKDLMNEGYIISYRGRKGSSITRKGLEFLKSRK